VLAYVLAGSGFGCGGRVDSVGDESTTEPTPATWSFGDERTWVISGPSQASSGTLYVLVHVTNEPNEVQLAVTASTDGDPETEVPLVETSRWLVALSRDGEELWRVELLPSGMRAAGSTATGVGPSLSEAPRWWDRPLVDEDGAVWACAHGPPLDDGGEKRISPEGVVLASRGSCLFHSQTAVGRDATIYQPVFGQLLSFDSDLSLRWRTPIQLPEGPPESQTSQDCEWTLFADSPSTVVGPNGLVYTSYLNSIDSDGGITTTPRVAGLAAFDPDSGELVRIVLPIDWVVSCEWSGLPPAAVDDDGVIFVDMGAAVVGVSPDGEGVFETPEDCLVGEPVIGREGLVGVCGGFDPSLTPARDEPPTPISIAVDGEPIAEVSGLGWLDQSNAIVLAEPGLVLLRTFDHEPTGEASANLAALDLEGNVVWQYAGEALAREPLVLPGDGVVYAVTTSRKLIAVEAPVAGIDRGPWPMPGGNLGGTHRVQSGDARP